MPRLLPGSRPPPHTPGLGAAACAPQTAPIRNEPVARARPGGWGAGRRGWGGGRGPHVFPHLAHRPPLPPGHAQSTPLPPLQSAERKRQKSGITKLMGPSRPPGRPRKQPLLEHQPPAAKGKRGHYTDWMVCEAPAAPLSAAPLLVTHPRPPHPTLQLPPWRQRRVAPPAGPSLRTPQPPPAAAKAG